ncbi:DUF4190 domain-containing protein [Streptomyces polygonati]|uniref:DUF4190 domain-containing protein n=1 Tax=Streptomyces polygonati TaxID=1617087 RepID=A0ABV8HKY9_9ACTN
MPYPQQQGWYVQRPMNGLAVASLVTSLCCAYPVGLILGIVALVQIRRRGERGKGLAIAGVVVSAVMTVLAALLIALAVTGALDEGNTRVTDLVAGDCFNTVHGSLPADGGVGLRAATVDVVPCSDRHDAETFRVFPLNAGLDGGYPGQHEAAEAAGAQCADSADDYLAGNALSDSMDIYSFTPAEVSWDRGDRDVTCFFGSPSGKVTGSVADAGSGSGFGV